MKYMLQIETDLPYNYVTQYVTNSTNQASMHTETMQIQHIITN